MLFNHHRVTDVVSPSHLDVDVVLTPAVFKQNFIIDFNMAGILTSQQEKPHVKHFTSLGLDKEHTHTRPHKVNADQ